MNKFQVKVNISELMHYSASLEKSFKKRDLLLLIKSFSDDLKDIYLTLLKEAIFSRRYKGNWEPVEDEKYLEYLGTRPKRHIYFLIEESLEVKKRGNYYIVQIDPYYKYPGTKLPLVNVVRAINFGTSEFRARPIFREVVNQLNDNMIDVYRGYLTLKGVV